MIRLKVKLKTFFFLVLVFVSAQACLVNTEPLNIAFLSKQTPHDAWHIFTMNADGSNLTQIKSGLIEDGCPNWSPDGRKLLFVSVNGTGTGLNREANLYLLNLNNLRLLQLTQGKSEIYTAAWSQDESRIVFSAGPKQNFVNLYIMNSDGSNMRQLTNTTSKDLNPKWSPDGKQILFASNYSVRNNENREFGIFTINPDGNNLLKLVDGYEKDFAPTWSPDGTRIAYYSIRFDERGLEIGSNIFVMDQNGSNKIQITNSPQSVFNISPSWSSDGRYFVFASNRDNIDKPDLFDIYVMNLDGSHVIRLTASGNNSCPVWRP